MRFRRLDLRRFGHFDGHEVDFGPGPAEGSPDIHLIYGPNEAGKSTILAAVLRLLHGFPRRDQEPYDFRHGEDLGVGAVVEGLPFHPEALEVTRIKPRNALVDGEGGKLPDDLFAGVLAGLSEKEHAKMFALDRVQVAAGGEDIQKARGEAGRIFFAAHAGLAGLSAALDRHQEAVQDIYRKSGQKQEVPKLKGEIGEVERRIRDLQILPAQYRELEEAFEAARERRAGADAALDALRAERDRRDRTRRLLEAGRRLEALDRALAGMGSVPDWPADPVPEGFSALRADHARHSSTLDTLARRIAEKTEARDAIRPDPGLLALEAPRAALEDRRRKAWNAASNLGPKAAEIAALTRQIGTELDALAPGAPALRPWILAPGDLGALRAAVALAEEARAHAETAQAALQAAEARLRESRRENAEGLAAPSLRPEAEAALEEMDLARLGAQLRAALEALDRAGEVARAALADLQLPGRSLRELPQTELTEAAVAALCDDLAAKERAAETAWDELAEAMEAREALAEALAAEEARLDAAALADPGRSRAERDAAWARHLEALDAATARAFEALMRADDAIAAAHLAHGAEIGGLRARRQTLAEADRRIGRLRDRLGTREAEAGAARAAYRQALAGLGLPAAMAPGELRDWFGGLARARRAETMLEAERAAHAPLIARAERAAETLRGLVGRDGDTLGLIETGAARLSAHLEAATRRAAARRRIARDLRGLRAARAQARAAHAAARAARHALDATAARLLPGDHGIADLAASLPVLETLAHLGQALGREVRAQASMETDARAFLEGLAGLGLREAVLPEDGGPLEDALRAGLAADEALGRRIAEARRQDDSRARLTREIEEDGRLREEAEAALAGIAARIDLFRARFPDDMAVEDHDALDAAIARAREATRLRADRASALRAIEALLPDALPAPGPARDAAIRTHLDAAAAEAPETAIEAEAASIRAAEQARDEAIAEQAAAGHALGSLRADAEVARLRSHREALRETLAEKALDWARGGIGQHLARLALDRYRQTHRSELMQVAGDAFEQLTEGRYSGLTSRDEAGREILVAQSAAEGRPRRADQMSEGTRMQLYFALRVAAHRAHVARHPPMPFLADDIFETFDDYRTSAALRLMAGIGLSGQAIYLTHHAHVAERARAACGADLRIHLLPGIPEADRDRLAAL